MTATAPAAPSPASAAPATADPRRWWSLAVLCLSLFLVVVDNTIVNTALPTLAQDLHATTSQLQWIVDAYTLAVAGLLLLFGSLGDRFGRDRALRAGLAVFAAGALLAALSSTPGQLIATRTLMGVGAAAIMPATLSILTSIFTDPRERARAIGIWTGVSGLGVAVGPTLSGWLLEDFAWPSVFLVNLPIIAVALFSGRRLVPPSRSPRVRRLDIPGALLSLAGVVALTYGLIEAPERGWTSAATLGTLGAAAVLLAAFVVVELRTVEPMVPLRVFSNRRFSAASASLTAVFFALFGTLFLLTQILQMVLGYSTLIAGISALPFALTLGIASPLSAGIAQRVGSKLPVVGGLSLMAGGLAFMATASAGSGYVHYLIATVLIAAGMGLTMAPATEAVMGALPPDQAGVGSAVNDTTRELGGVLGVAVLGSVASSAYAHKLAGGLAGLPEQARHTAHDSLAGALSVAGHVGGAAGGEIVAAAREAFIAAANRGVLIAAGVAVLGAVLALRWLPARSAEEAATLAQGAVQPAGSARAAVSAA